jgi:hypothetical protein
MRRIILDEDINDILPINLGGWRDGRDNNIPNVF